MDIFIYINLCIFLFYSNLLMYVSVEGAAFLPSESLKEFTCDHNMLEEIPEELGMCLCGHYSFLYFSSLLFSTDQHIGLLPVRLFMIVLFSLTSQFLLLSLLQDSLLSLSCAHILFLLLTILFLALIFFSLRTM